MTIELVEVTDDDLIEVPPNELRILDVPESRPAVHYL